MAGNPHCECAAAGWCKRHQMEKTARDFELCKGIAGTIDCGRKYWLAWENGKLGATRPPNPIMEPAPFCLPLGMGDLVARGISAVTLGTITPCGGCKDRQALLNHWAPFDNLPPLETVKFTRPVRHLMCHLWPVKSYGAWQWNCDRIKASADLFNGRRIIAIAADQSTDSPDAVREYLADFDCEFIVATNSPKLREVVTFLPMLELLEKYQSDQDVTFSCHGKCVRHNLRFEDSGGSTIFKWTQAMYDTCLRWDAVEPLLETYGCAGSFRRYMNARRGSWGPWHYSGSFYWFRNRDVYRRNWRYVPQQFFGTEAWPGWLFKPEEAAVIFADNVSDLYTAQHWAQIEPLLEEWHRQHPLPEPQT